MESTMYSLRILSKGQITNLSQGFRLGSGDSFSVFLKPKKVTMDTCSLIQCKLLGDTEFGNFPVPHNDWTPGAIKEIAPNGIDLTSYDVFWGAGTNVSLNK